MRPKRTIQLPASAVRNESKRKVNVFPANNIHEEDFVLDYKNLEGDISVAFCPQEENRNPVFVITSGCKLFIYNWGYTKPIAVFGYMLPEEVLRCCTWVNGSNPHCSCIVAGGQLGRVYIIRANDESMLTVFAHNGEIRDMTALPEKVGAFVTASADRTMKLISARTGRCLRVFEPLLQSFDEIMSAELSLRTGWVIFGGSSKSVNFMWNWGEECGISVEERRKPPVVSNPCVLISDLHKDAIKRIRWFGNLIVSLSMDGVLQVWLPEIIEIDHSLKYYVINPRPICCMNDSFMDNVTFTHFTVHAGKSVLAAANTQKIISIWTLKIVKGKKLPQLLWTRTVEKEVMSLEFDTCGNFLIAGMKPSSFIGWRLSF
ncbi:Polycomb group protein FERTILIZATION-INDEPENDENT ENDOSPERM [Trichinella patagoniensis]|uniref:Polycomb group protein FERTILIZATION-INDEPENDENT ENDOSPERM n=1 Tax=Trichinella patagoniensis TaxID=990121 RepID=A0A0V0ZCR0_9BILA|nr:Polycomb group protein FERTILIZATION-INDEPENDENT ENDOSPERM [Trichinella patagoniensis]